MPVKITKIDGKYRVSTPNQVHSKGTTLKKAMAQERLLNAVKHGWKPTGKRAKTIHSKGAHSPTVWGIKAIGLQSIK